MSQDEQEQPKSVADVMLAVLRAASGGWLTRKEIATKMGRPNGTLLPHDVDVLGGLVAGGSVKQERRSIGLVKQEYIYRVEV